MNLCGTTELCRRLKPAQNGRYTAITARLKARPFKTHCAITLLNNAPFNQSFSIWRAITSL